MVLAGSFTEYPLFLLLEILSHRRETGLLEVSSPKQSGYFFVKNGEIKDGDVGKVKGAAAIELAGGFVDAFFQFKQLTPTDYARIVWEKSFGHTRFVVTHHLFASKHSEQAAVLVSPGSGLCILEGVVVSLAQRVLRHFYSTPASTTALKRLKLESSPRGGRTAHTIGESARQAGKSRPDA